MLTVGQYNVYLRHPCQKCKKSGIASVGAGFGVDRSPEYDDTWHIPSRCFVDVGFQKLDPFGKGEVSEPSTPTSASIRSSLDEDPLALPLSPTKARNADANICRKLLRRLTMRKPSPCCATEAQRGGYQATRIEGRDYRVDGFIPGRCQSPV